MESVVAGMPEPKKNWDVVATDGGFCWIEDGNDWVSFIAWLKESNPKNISWDEEPPVRFPCFVISVAQVNDYARCRGLNAFLYQDEMNRAMGVPDSK